MRIALAQMNSHLGNFPLNMKKTEEMARQALKQVCDLVVFPELNLLGYPPQDLLDCPHTMEAHKNAQTELLQKLPPSIYCLVGGVTPNETRGKAHRNSALLIHGGKILKSFHKQQLPVYDVFDDSRHFAPGNMGQNQFQIKGKTIQLLICEDMWSWDRLYEQNPILDLDPRDIDIVVNMSASPFTLEKKKQKKEYALKTIKALEAPLIYVNMVGAQDELIYDGGSFALDKKGKQLAQSPYYKENLNVVDMTLHKGQMYPVPQKPIDSLRQALVLGLRDFVAKTGFKKVHLGLSGGIDSAVVACLAAEAMVEITAIALPSRFNDPLSLELAKKLAENLNCEFHVLPIEKTYESLVSSYESCFGPQEFSILHENFQARLRGLLLMGYANDKNSLLLSTGNKSEYATGYATLYGDMCGGLAPIGDLLKGQVYELAASYNKKKELIPEKIIHRPPTAELKPHQKDSDSLPDYPILDASVDRLVNQKQKASSSEEQWLLQRLYASEFKRRQAPPILKVSSQAFGGGWRRPIARG